MIGFWKRFKAQAAVMNITKKEAAAALGLKYSSFCNYQVSNRIPRTEFSIKLAKLLRVSVEWLVTGEENDDFISPEKFYSLLKATIEAYRGIDSSDPVLMGVAKNPYLHKIAAFYLYTGEERIRGVAVALGLVPPENELQDKEKKA